MILEIVGIPVRSFLGKINEKIQISYHFKAEEVVFSLSPTLCTGSLSKHKPVNPPCTNQAPCSRLHAVVRTRQFRAVLGISL